MGLSVSPYATAYVPHKSLKDNACVHVGKKVILKLDIKDFFPFIPENPHTSPPLTGM